MQGLLSRKIAVEVLLKVEQEGLFANKALSAAFTNRSLAERDRAFVTYIVQGTLRHQLELDDIIAKFSKIKLDKISPPIRMVLRCSLFQLIHMADMPPSAVINTAVELARKTGHEGSSRFVNGVLRSFERTREEMPIAKTGATKTGPKALPEWMVRRWMDRFGEAETRLLVDYFQKIPTLTLRTCQMSISVDGLASILQGKAMKVEKSKLMPSCLNVLDRGPISGPVSKIPGYAEGLFVVQDEASAFVSTVLGAQPGQTIVDLCAAPGGKSLHLGEIMENKGRVIAVDVSEKRLALLAAERRRLGLTNIEAVVKDGRDYQPESKVDAVLVDAPCSGTGVLNRRADLRLNRQEADIASLVKIQQSLLENAARMVKEGGVLVYSTCSMEAEENEKNVAQFLQSHFNFKLDNLEPFFNSEILAAWSSQSHWLETQKQLQTGQIQLLPSRHGCSGFFICRLKKELP